MRLYVSLQTDPPRGGIPIFVDSMKKNPDFLMTRCNYLTLERDEPARGKFFRDSDEFLNLFLLGFEGIVQKPFDAQLFDAPELIEDLFHQTEEAGLNINIDDIWLPNFLLEGQDSEVSPGDTYRIRYELFLEAYRFRDGQIDKEYFLERCRELDTPVVFSESETEAFKAWHQQEIDTAFEIYPKNATYELSWTE